MNVTVDDLMEASVIVGEEGNSVGAVRELMDMLKLVEDHRFTMKNAPNESKRKGEKRA